ncbi:FHA domain-containing protein [Nostocaceae cyanobacterium CENA369]|uniref:FHA domain-containing protein n=1 Tax=Dendronalium phyllosphericum CENA369 TaxID=1725256 RepID=A0A8J7I480_9NOST|nr:FHA domain-containing protein [Dendronalium phyllosphericum]MBH8572172.1 FHA domain-containing protein [Dendronalium phyllosphericum CENA369]
MNALTLQWHDAGQNKTQNIYEQQPSKNPGTVRIGRDPLRCDIVVSNPTVSGLHVEIFFHTQQQRFFIRNLRSQNPPLVDGHQLAQGERPLSEGSAIYLGQMQLQVTAIVINSIPATILTPPQPSARNSHPPIPLQQPQINPIHHHHQPAPQGVYGLECPKCHRISSAENLQIGCPWCGTSLAAAVSVLVAPSN